MKLKDFFDSPKKWTKKAIARSAVGNPVGADSHEAVCWCLTGATLKLWPGDEQKHFRNDIYRKMLATAEGLGYLTASAHTNLIYLEGSTTYLNDLSSITFDDVKKLLEQADI